MPARPHADGAGRVFFSYEPLHNEAARNRRAVPFEGEAIPILGPVELAVFKTIFDRTRDWADVEAMLDAGNLDADAVRDRLIALVGRDDDRLGETLRRGPGAYSGGWGPAQSGYSSLRQARGASSPGLGVRSSRNEWYGATNGSGAMTV